MRIVVVDSDLCNPKKCSLECIKVCPVNRKKKDCIVLKDKSVEIDESLCIGCGLCEKKCPLGALKVVNTPEELKETPVHRFGKNGFVLYRLPIPEKGEVTGLLGPNGTGKTTAMLILSGKLKPNLGKPQEENSYEDLSRVFRGSELQKYFIFLSEGKKTVYKPQQVDKITNFYKGRTSRFLKKADERGVLDNLLERLSIEHVMDRNIENLSGGELQRVAIAAAFSREADIYFFDEISSYLDVKQRLEAGKLIRELAHEKTVMVVEHDLTTLDFLADKIHIFYGRPGAYGVVSKPYSVRSGINTFLEGYIKEDNVRFRKEPIKIEVRAHVQGKESKILLSFPNLEKKMGGFSLRVDSGDMKENEIIGVFGANALGKTTFARILAGELKPDKGKVEKNVEISYKPQYITIDFEGTVLDLLQRRMKNPFSQENRNSIIRPLNLETMMNLNVKGLSGGELQRVAIALCLSKDSDVYLLDEPSAYLDIEQRLSVANIIKKFIQQKEAACLVVDHDLLFLDYISDRGMIFLGESGKRGHGMKPTYMGKSFNVFLKDMDITYRRDPLTGRPRANKPDSVKDREQKEKGEYYYVK